MLCGRSAEEVLGGCAKLTPKQTPGMGWTPITQLYGHCHEAECLSRCICFSVSALRNQISLRFVKKGAFSDVFLGLFVSSSFINMK